MQDKVLSIHEVAVLACEDDVDELVAGLVVMLGHFAHDLNVQGLDRELRLVN